MPETTKNTTDRTKPAVPDFPADAVSTILETLHFIGGCFGRPTLRAPWGIRIEREAILKMFPGKGAVANFHAILNGTAVLECSKEIDYLADGDIVFFKDIKDHTLASDVNVKPIRIHNKSPESMTQTQAQCNSTNYFEGNSGPETTAIFGSIFYPHQPSIHPMLSILPDKIILSRSGDESRQRVDQVLDFIASESQSNRIASKVLVNRLCDVLFIQIVRHAIEKSLASEPSWLGGLQDYRIQEAIMAIHEYPGVPWDIKSLAQRAGMSRTNFARRFVEKVGEPPLTYLTRWRMHLAANMLLQEAESIISIAEHVGYSSEPGFCRAFTQMVGVSPSKFRKSYVPPKH